MVRCRIGWVIWSCQLRGRLTSRREVEGEETKGTWPAGRYHVIPPPIVGDKTQGFSVGNSVPLPHPLPRLLTQPQRSSTRRRPDHADDVNAFTPLHACTPARLLTATAPCDTRRLPATSLSLSPTHSTSTTALQAATPTTAHYHSLLPLTTTAHYYLLLPATKPRTTLHHAVSKTTPLPASPSFSVPWLLWLLWAGG